MLTCCFGNILIWSPHVDIETSWHKTNILDFVPSILKLSLSWLRGSVCRCKRIWMIKGDFSNEWNCQLIVFKLFNSSMNQMPLCWWRVASWGEFTAMETKVERIIRSKQADYVVKTLTAWRRWFDQRSWRQRRQGLNGQKIWWLIENGRLAGAWGEKLSSVLF